MADPSTYRPRTGSIPTQPGVYRFRDKDGRVVYVGKADEPAVPAVVVLPGRGQPARPHGNDGHHGGLRRVDRGRDRGRGPAAGVLLDQGVRPAVQREVPRRQVLPVARDHHERGVPARDGRSRREEEGREVLRPLQPRVGHQGHRRHPAARLPDAFVQQRGVQAVRADRPPLPPRLHRQVLRPLRGPGGRRGAPRDRRGLRRLHGRTDRRVRQAHPEADVRRLRGPGLRAGSAPARRPGRTPQGAGEAGGRLRRRHRRRRDRARRGPARGRGADLPRAGRPHPGPTGLGRRPGRGPRHRWSGQRVPAPALRRRGRRRDPARDPGAGDARGRRDLRAAAVGEPGEQGLHPGPPAGRQARAPGDGRPERVPVTGPPQDQAGQRPDRSQPGARGDPGGARPAVGAAAGRVLRHLQPPGHRGGRLDGGLRGRVAAQERVPPVRDPRASTDRTTSRRCTR